MKKAYISRFISNFIRAIALVLCAIMCMSCFIACSEGSNKNEDGRDKDISSNVDSVHDSWESVLDAFLNAVEKGDSDTLLSLIAPAVSDTMRTPPNSVEIYLGIVLDMTNQSLTVGIWPRLRFMKSGSF